MNDETRDNDESNEVPSGDLIEDIRSRLPEGPLEASDLARFLGELVTVEVRRLVHFEGPLPPPEMLQQYEEIQTGFADRIVLRAEKEQQHRHKVDDGNTRLEDRALTHAATQSYIGQACALVIAVLAIGGGIYLAANDKSLSGIIAIVTALVGLAAVFITGKVIDGLTRTKVDIPQDNDEEKPSTRPPD